MRGIFKFEFLVSNIDDHFIFVFIEESYNAQFLRKLGRIEKHKWLVLPQWLYNFLCLSL